MEKMEQEEKKPLFLVISAWQVLRDLNDELVLRLTYLTCSGELACKTQLMNRNAPVLVI